MILTAAALTLAAETAAKTAAADVAAVTAAPVTVRLKVLGTIPGFNEKNVYFRGCEGRKTCNLGNVPIEYQGCILDISLRLKNVCPGKRVAVGISLYEVDSCGVEYPEA